MLNALLYLRFTSFKNWVISRVRRLRQPKYLVGAIVGCAYFYFFFFRPLDRAPSGRGRTPATDEMIQVAQAATAALPADWLPLSLALGALALLLFTTLMWIVPAQRAALGFSEAEIAFLFPAPITRRALVHFRLLSSQFRSLAGATIMMLFSNRWTFVGGNAFTHAIGWWVIFSGLNLHFSGANFTLTRLADLGLGAWRRRMLAVGFVAAVGVATWAGLPAAKQLPAVDPSAGFRPISEWVLLVTQSAPLSWLLLPFKLVLGPFLAGDPRTFALALLPALGVLAVHYLWVVRSAVAFEESSLDYAQKRASRIAAWKSGVARPGAGPAKARRAPFILGDHGRPEFAFFWKNLLSTWPYFTRRVFLGCAAVIAVGCIWLNTHPAWRGFLPGIGASVGVFAVYVLVVGPQFARQDIRSDLANADVLKTYPLHGWQVVLGELLAPVAILTGVLWLGILTVALTLHPAQPGLAWLTPSLRLACALALAVIAPALTALQLLVPNAAALLFPGWFQTSRTRGGGPEVIGQRMIFFFAQLVTMLLALIPAVGLAALLIFILQWLIGPILAVALATCAVLIVLLGEVWCGVWLLGRRFEKLDLSAELRA